jgi:hypothetical protein
MAGGVETDPTVWKWLTGAVVVLAIIVWGMLKAKIDGALPTTSFDGYVSRAEKSREEQRETIIKLFEQMREHEKQDNARFEKLLDTVHQQHAELLRAIAKREGVAGQQSQRERIP